MRQARAHGSALDSWRDGPLWMRVFTCERQRAPCTRRASYASSTVQVDVQDRTRHAAQRRLFDAVAGTWQSENRGATDAAQGLHMMDNVDGTGNGHGGVLRHVFIRVYTSMPMASPMRDACFLASYESSYINDIHPSHGPAVPHPRPPHAHSPPCYPKRSPARLRVARFPMRANRSSLGPFAASGNNSLTLAAPATPRI